MTQAQHTHTGTGSLVPAAAAAFVMAAALAMTALLSGQLPQFSLGGSVGVVSRDQAVIDAGRAWQLQREQQAGVGAIIDAVRAAAADWEAQRKAQNGGSQTSVDIGPTDPKIR
jgi:hypothetical protein